MRDSGRGSSSTWQSSHDDKVNNEINLDYDWKDNNTNKIDRLISRLPVFKIDSYNWPFIFSIY